MRMRKRGREKLWMKKRWIKVADKKERLRKVEDEKGCGCVREIEKAWG